jgi:hypothetical protein
MLEKIFLKGEGMANKEPYGVRRAAVESGFCAKHVYDLLYAGRIPGAYKKDGQWFIPAASVEALKERKQGQ